MAGNNVRRNFVGQKRQCSQCSELIIITEQMAKRSRYICRSCDSRNAGEWAKRNREKKRAANNAYHSRISGKRAESTAAWLAKHPEKRKAHQAVQTALRNGSLTKKPCEVCGSTVRIHAHHDNYNKPLAVVWLCHTHHMERHAMLKARQQKGMRHDKT